MNNTVEEIRRAIEKESDEFRAAHSATYFKFEPGVTDVFLGVTVPKQRVIANAYYNQITPEQVCDLLHSTIHEERLTALLMWVLQYKKGSSEEQKTIFDLYLQNTEWINNWDLVDTSARDIVGAQLYEHDLSLLKKLSTSRNIWERRIAIIATFYFIQRGEFGPTIELAEHYLDDTHHYIHKAVGWALRELGKKDESVLRDFLDKHATRMPRTMLRYAIERLSPQIRAEYLAKKV